MDCELGLGTVHSPVVQWPTMVKHGTLYIIELQYLSKLLTHGRFHHLRNAQAQAQLEVLIALYISMHMLVH